MNSLQTSEIDAPLQLGIQYISGLSSIHYGVVTLIALEDLYLYYASYTFEKRQGTWCCVPKEAIAFPSRAITTYFLCALIFNAFQPSWLGTQLTMLCMPRRRVYWEHVELRRGVTTLRGTDQWAMGNWSCWAHVRGRCLRILCVSAPLEFNYDFSYRIIRGQNHGRIWARLEADIRRKKLWDHVDLQ
jgi:hypothetical protein